MFGVSYHPAHVNRLLRALGQSVQLLVTQATQRDEVAIQTYQDARWRELKKADAQGRIIVWVDEAGFYLLPGEVRTYTPRGHMPCCESHARAIIAGERTGVAARAGGGVS